MLNTSIIMRYRVMCMFCVGNFSAELLGLPLVPPYSQASGSGQQLLQGVNYASAAAGILDDSGGNFVRTYPSMHAWSL
jgi:hypothetical protein